MLLHPDGLLFLIPATSGIILETTLSPDLRPRVFHRTIPMPSSLLIIKKFLTVQYQLAVNHLILSSAPEWGALSQPEIILLILCISWYQRIRIIHRLITGDICLLSAEYGFFFYSLPRFEEKNIV